MENAFTEGLDTEFDRTGHSRSVAGLYLKAVSFLALLLGLFIAAPWYVIHHYNGLQRKGMAADAQWSQMISQYGRRADLSLNLAATVRSRAVHEPKAIDDVAVARTRLAALVNAAAHSRGQQMLDELQKAHNQLSRSITGVLQVAEAYPELQSSIVFNDLMVQLENAENRIAYSRQRYIGAAADYNAELRRFPTSLIALQTGSRPRPVFTVGHEPSLSAAR